MIQCLTSEILNDTCILSSYLNKCQGNRSGRVGFIEISLVVYDPAILNFNVEMIFD